MERYTHRVHEERLRPSNNFNDINSTIGETSILVLPPKLFMANTVEMVDIFHGIITFT